MKLDARKLSHKTLEELRIRTVKQVMSGESPEVLAKVLGVSRTAVYNWLSTYKKHGYKGLGSKPISGRPPKLQGKDLKWLGKILIDKTPNQLKMEFALWTRGQVKDLIKRELGIKVSKTAVTRILDVLGYTFQKPAGRFAQQDPVIVKKWQEADYPKIKAEAKKAGAEIYFGDEAGVSTMSYKLAKTIGKKGKTPIIKRSNNRHRINMISAVSAQGSCRFMVVEKTVNGEVFVEFLKRLMHKAENPIYLILDNHPIHKTKKVSSFVEKQKGQLKLFFLPPYSPELNPDELVWNDVKSNGLSRHLISTADSLKALVCSKLHSLQKSKMKIKSFFKTSTTAYTLA